MGAALVVLDHDGLAVARPHDALGPAADRRTGHVLELRALDGEDLQIAVIVEQRRGSDLGRSLLGPDRKKPAVGREL